MKKKNRDSSARDHITYRSNFIFILLFVILLLFSARLVQIQIIKRDFYTKKASRYQERLVKIKPRRGNLYDRNGKVLSMSVKLNSLFAIPRQIEHKREFARKVSEILNISEENIFKSISNDRYFVWLARKVDFETVKRTKALGYNSIGTVTEYKRFYPDPFLASNLIGAVGIDNNGLAGIEYYYDDILKGKEGIENISLDGRGKISSIFSNYVDIPHDGEEMVLTIDSTLQYFVESELLKQCRKVKPLKACAIIVNPKTGEILVMANYPPFNNNQASLNIGNLKNFSITDIFEPGSTFKVIPGALLLENDIVKLNDIVYCENGKMKTGSRTIHDYKKYKRLTFSEVIEKSSNIGIIKFSQKLLPRDLYLMILKFGLGAKTGIDLPGESSGLVRDFRQWDKSSMLSIPMGQEVAVTPLQMLMAYSSIANNGVLVKPYLIKNIGGEEVSPSVIRQVMSEETAIKLKGILFRTVENGTAKGTRIEGIQICAKTGTAQKFIKETNMYSEDKYFSSFIGFFPKDDPIVCMGIFMDEPRNKYYAGEVAAPVFKNIAEDIIKYYNLNINTIRLTNQNITVQREEHKEFYFTEGFMPDLKNRTLSEITPFLVKYNGNVTIKGSGLIVKQVPEPNIGIDMNSKIEIYLN